MNCWAGWSTSWNQDCWKKCQKPQICRWHYPYGKMQRGTKEPLDENERGERKKWLKLNIQKTKIMASSHISSWQIDGKQWKQWESLLKSRDNASLTKVCLVKAMFLPVVMYGCEYWAIKKAECRRIDGFKLWCWRRFFFFEKEEDSWESLGLQGDQTSQS